MNLGHVIDRASRRYARRVAVQTPTERVTFGELGERIGRLAVGLREAGLRPGDRVLDLQRNSLRYVETDLALAAAGLCRVALNYRQSPPDWAMLAADCTPKAIIYAGSFAHAARDLALGLDLAICVDDGGDDESLDSFTARAGGTRAVLDYDPSTLVSLNYSSGTSGSPKGSRRTHANRLASLHNMISDVFQGLPAADDVWCHAAPMTHASGLFVLPSYVLGARQVVLPGFDPDGFLETVGRFAVTGSVLVPTMVARLLQTAPPAGALAGMRHLAYAGAPMAEQQIMAAYEGLTPNLVNMYGMVEAVPPVSILNPTEHRVAIEEGHDWLRSCGTVCTSVAIEIRDDAGTALPEGELGEVFIAGGNVMSGYWGREEESDVKSVVDGWLRAGDVGYLADDRLYVVDRRGDMIITGGYNVYPSEVETALRAVAGVRDVVVFGVADPEWGQVVTAVYTGTPGLEADLDAHCRAHLSGYKKPRVVHHVQEFPVNHNGKVSRRDVAALTAARSAD